MPNVNVNQIDYAHLAHLAETSRVPFHTLCQRAEKGESMEDYVQEDPREWVDYHEAAKILSMSYSSLASTFTSHHCLADYFGVKWRSKSRNNPKSKRGCGVLFKREDLVRITEIKKVIGISQFAALKVFQAMRLGNI